MPGWKDIRAAIGKAVDYLEKHHVREAATAAVLGSIPVIGPFLQELYDRNPESDQSSQDILNFLRELQSRDESNFNHLSRILAENQEAIRRGQLDLAGLVTRSHEQIVQKLDEVASRQEKALQDLISTVREISGAGSQAQEQRAVDPFALAVWAVFKTMVTGIPSESDQYMFDRMTAAAERMGVPTKSIGDLWSEVHQRNEASLPADVGPVKALRRVLLARVTDKASLLVFDIAMRLAAMQIASVELKTEIEKEASTEPKSPQLIGRINSQIGFLDEIDRVCKEALPRISTVLRSTLESLLTVHAQEREILHSMDFSVARIGALRRCVKEAGYLIANLA